MNVIRRGIGIILLLAVITFLGVTAYNWYKENHQTQDIELPSTALAEYRVKIKNTGLTIFTDKVITQAVPGKVSWITRQLYSYTLPEGYWEANGKEFIYKAVTNPPLVLDERTVGPVEVSKR